MKSKFKRYMKNTTVRFSLLLITYYLFLYFMARLVVSLLEGSYQLTIVNELACHLFAIVFLILSFITHENNDNNNTKPV